MLTKMQRTQHRVTTQMDVLRMLDGAVFGQHGLVEWGQQGRPNA